MANDACVLNQTLHIAFTKPGHGGDVEISKCRAEIFAFAQDRQPGKAGLETFQADFFKQAIVIILRHAPFGVVIGAVVTFVVMPIAADPAIVTLHQPLWQVGFSAAHRSDPGLLASTLLHKADEALVKGRCRLILVDQIGKAIGHMGFALVLAASVWIWGTPSFAQGQNRFTDRELIAGFDKAVFASEYSNTWGGVYVRKFAGDVRFHVSSRMGTKAKQKVEAFIKTLPRKIDGLTIKIVDQQKNANFIVYVVDRASYARTIRSNVFSSPNAPVRGKCMVRSTFSWRGISLSKAVIVADEGKTLFERCLAEEILQGLGPLNDDPSLTYSLFNDESSVRGLERFDRIILNLLYSPALRPGMKRQKALQLLPQILPAVRRYVDKN